MNFDLYFDIRIRQLLHEFNKTCVDFALAEEKRKYLYEQLEPIIKSVKEISISCGDCMNILDYIDTTNVLLCLTSQEFYKSGFYDCLALLRETKL